MRPLVLILRLQMSLARLLGRCSMFRNIRCTFLVSLWRPRVSTKPSQTQVWMKNTKVNEYSCAAAEVPEV